MTALFIITAALCGIAAGFGLAVWSLARAVRRTLNRSDICPDDRRYIYDLLGIPENESASFKRLTRWEA